MKRIKLTSTEVLKIYNITFFPGIEPSEAVYLEFSDDRVKEAPPADKSFSIMRLPNGVGPYGEENG